MPEPDESHDRTRPEAQMLWGVKIRLRDGVHLNATLYLPNDSTMPAPAELDRRADQAGKENATMGMIRSRRIAHGRK